MLPAALLSAAKSPPLTLARHRVPREQVFLFLFFSGKESREKKRASVSSHLLVPSLLSKTSKKKPSPSHRLRHRLELQCVPARVPEEHRPLLPRLPLKPQPRPQLAPDPSGRHPGGQLAELGHGEREAKVRHRDRVPVDRRGGGPGVVALDLVADELVAVEVEVDPGGAGAALGAAEGAVASFLGGWVGFFSSSGAGRSSARPRWSFFLPLFPGLVPLSLSLSLSLPLSLSLSLARSLSLSLSLSRTPHPP